MKARKPNWARQVKVKHCWPIWRFVNKADQKDPGIIQEVTASDPYISIQLQTTWKKFCPSLGIFRNELSKLTEIKVNLIVVINADQNCLDGGDKDKKVFAYVNVMRDDGTTEVSSEDTVKVRDAIERRKTIASFKVVSVNAHNVASKAFHFTEGTILLIIGIVLGIYLIGYFLILGVQSYSSSDPKDKPLSFILAAENKHFVDGIKRHKSTQFNFSRVSNKKVHIIEDVPAS